MGLFGMIGDMASSGIGASANLAATAMTNASNERIADKNNQAQMDLWKSQMEHDLDMWNRENEYNDPAAQMRRLENAGVNPLVAFGGSNNPTGVATESAGGQTPPSLHTPTMQVPNLDFASLSQAALNMAQARKTESEGNIAGQQFEWIKDMALQGVNPELIKTGVSLQTYNNMKAQGKYIPQFMEGQIKKMNAETDYYEIVRKEREEYVNQIKAQTAGIKFTNQFNAAKAPFELAKLYTDIVTELQHSQNETNKTVADINLANAEAGLAGAQKELVTQQTASEQERAFTLQFENGLRKMGINPNDKNLPFFIYAAKGLSDKSITAEQLSTFFENLVYADKVGWDKIVKSNANLTKFSLWGQPRGLFGSGIDIPSIGSMLHGILTPSPAITPVEPVTK